MHGWEYLVLMPIAGLALLYIAGPVLETWNCRRRAK
jgi:hypothetical protein